MILTGAWGCSLYFLGVKILSTALGVLSKILTFAYSMVLFRGVTVN